MRKDDDSYCQAELTLNLIQNKDFIMQTIINTKLQEFKVQAFHNNEFKTVSSEDLAGKWAVFFFYPADFTFVCPTELGDLADKYEELQKLVWKSTL